MSSSLWISMESARLFVDFLTPFAIAVFGLYLHRAQWWSQKLIEKRLAVHDSLMPKINALYCYFTYVGEWKNVEPASILNLKRQIDREAHLARPLFSRASFAALMNFQESCFRMYQPSGRDALLRTGIDKRRKAYLGTWPHEWDAMFSSERNEKNVKNAYERVIRAFSKDIGVHG